MLALTKQIQANPVRHHPGTLREVVDAWWLMGANDRAIYPLHVAAQALTYSDAFGPLGNSTGEIASLDCARIIISGSAWVMLLSWLFLCDHTMQIQGWRQITADYCQNQIWRS